MAMISDSDAYFLRAVRDGNLEEVVSLLDKGQDVDTVNFVSADLFTITFLLYFILLVQTCLSLNVCFYIIQ